VHAASRKTPSACARVRWLISAWQQDLVAAALGGPDRLWPVAQAVAAAVPGTVFVARDDSGVSQRTTVDNFTLLCRAPQRRGRSDPVRLLSD